MVEAVKWVYYGVCCLLKQLNATEVSWAVCLSSTDTWSGHTLSPHHDWRRQAVGELLQIIKWWPLTADNLLLWLLEGRHMEGTETSTGCNHAKTHLQSPVNPGLCTLNTQITLLPSSPDSICFIFYHCLTCQTLSKYVFCVSTALWTHATFQLSEEGSRKKAGLINLRLFDKRMFPSFPVFFSFHFSCFFLCVTELSS